MIPKTLTFSRKWEVGQQVGSGGFGKVFAIKSEGKEAVAKFVPMAKGASRELLFVDLSGIRNIVPIIDSGQIEDYWVLVMPRADRSLRDLLVEKRKVEIPDAIKILRDIVDSLIDLDNKVVHRDLKPENVLLLNGAWCLADFGISRYAEATTSVDTHKYAMTPAYAAPERWLAQRATTATDIYSVGVITYEMLNGTLPFAGQQTEDLRDQHLNDMPSLDGISPKLSALILDCLAKMPQVRPSPRSLRGRLDRLDVQEGIIQIPSLEQANLSETRRREAEALKIYESQSLSERRNALAENAKVSFARLSDELINAIVAAAPSASITSYPSFLRIGLGGAKMVLSKPTFVLPEDWSTEIPVIDVVMSSYLGLSFKADQWGYEGRSHSLWYCDAQEKGKFGWFETAFMFNPLLQRSATQEPFGLSPGEEAAEAISPGIGSFRVAWPFTEILPGEPAEFIKRWGEWLGKGSQGALHRPSTMPEKNPRGSWRMS